MKNLEEIRFNEAHILLKDNRVKGSILPEKMAELGRNISIQENTIIEGPVYAHKLEIQNGETELQGAVFAQLEVYVNSDARGAITFRQSVGAVGSVVSRGTNCRIMFCSDINAGSVALYNAYVAGSIYADSIVLENCVVIGGVFATQHLTMTNCIVGTFNAPAVDIAQNVSLLLPSAFSIEKIRVGINARLYNLTLADLGSLYRRLPQSPNSGKIALDMQIDEVETTLANDKVQKKLRSYTVIGKVLAADLLDTDKFQNHFLLTAASLGSQLLKTYDMGKDSDGETISLSQENIREFFFDILHGKIEVQEIDGSFDISQITGKFN
ncbi:MAG: hypothetical protein LBM06_06910 [Prevotellaceae bacterium]|jgi:hypothetical protein|nr:hypothetical protein [Prevotellaceae bacterium]